MVKVRLARGGSKGAPFYRIVVTDSRSARDSRFIERIGFFNPVSFSKNNSIKFDVRLERLKYWLHQGAKLSIRVSTLIKKYKKNIQKQ